MYHCSFHGLLTADLLGRCYSCVHVQLQQVCGCFMSQVHVLAGIGSLYKDNLFPERMFFSPFESGLRTHRQISENGLLKVL